MRMTDAMRAQKNGAMIVKPIDAISEHFDPDNESAIARAVNQTMLRRLKALQTNNFEDNWIEVLATVYPADGDGFIVNAMFVPLACMREVGEVLQKYTDDINRLTAQVQHTNGVTQ